MKELHKIQMIILRELLFKPNSRFTDLNIVGLSNDHFSYHIRVLIESGLVEKSLNKYLLSTKGKEFANRMDTETAVIEKQPKTSVLIIPEFISDSGKKTYAVQRRLKEPYYGYHGFMTGKVRYGETIFDASHRELTEEMGLSGTFEHLFVLHEMVYNQEGLMLEDKFFHIVKVSHIMGELLQEIEGGQNLIMNEEEFYKMTPLYHNEIKIYEWFKSGQKGFIEEKYFIDSF